MAFVGRIVGRLAHSMCSCGNPNLKRFKGLQGVAASTVGNRGMIYQLLSFLDYVEIKLSLPTIKLFFPNTAILCATCFDADCLGWDVLCFPSCETPFVVPRQFPDSPFPQSRVPRNGQNSPCRVTSDHEAHASRREAPSSGPAWLDA
jgi:hypothetical protein